MSVVTIQEDKQFVQTYIQLIGLSENAPLDKFNSTTDYNKLESLGPSLPRFKVPFPVASSGAISEQTISLKFKSIKPPFRFTVDSSAVPTSSTIFKIKTDLIESVPILKEAGVTPANLKLMLKSKVVHDSSALSSLPNVESEVTFNVMVSAPDASKTVPVAEPVTAPVVETVADTKEINPLQITESTWNKISDILKEDLGEERGGQALDKLKTNWK
ncbi:predicted protein [Scheffersomyces stipitis CBS 6054]|uniref:Ubiquitin-like domain-containing protein n=1 Tax=Scheffersomyces stipitis (strain ATCC 58785 / CBS 6054 / NBRC 10063 / NRRL Y-11545) TaxID=322104 RepID=A3LZA7_PICST|nr:predicted protein [Scheffersomyces stipitis CBS 6054]ABN68123.1 predicted protein [Scheffersomyces stipitis CBS 6054]KAG2734237.1 hypothetical protein G9P44_002243 [Scheffersomyces stipitis]